VLSRHSDTLHQLNDLLESLQTVEFPTLRGDVTDIGLIKQYLGKGHLVEIGKFYDRRDTIWEWYYQCYGLVRFGEAPALTPITGSVASWLGVTFALDSVVIVKNGPDTGGWRADLSIDSEAVGRSIWWYMRSGNDRAQVFGEREFSRFVRGM
jgi:hypothetical protein